MDNINAASGMQGESADPSGGNQIPESETKKKETETKSRVRDWPGKSEPGHIKPIGPAFLPGSNSGSQPDEGE
jgi:hypothetical protein